MNDDILRLKSLLIDQNLSIAVAESLTAGNLQAAISSVSGSSEYFSGGVTVYNIDQKVNLLGVNRKHAASVNCVSEQVAAEMAQGVRKMFGSDIGIATTGYAEPWAPGGIETPFAWTAFGIKGKTHTEKIEPTISGRVAIQRLVTETALAKLIHHLT